MFNEFALTTRPYIRTVTEVDLSGKLQDRRARMYRSLWLHYVRLGFWNLLQVISTSAPSPVVKPIALRCAY